MVAGLGTITPASGFVGPGGALVIGISAGFVCYNATVFLKQKLKIDDSLDVFPVHGVGGLLGTLLAASLPAMHWAYSLGRVSGVSMGEQLYVQVIGVVATGLMQRSRALCS